MLVLRVLGSLLAAGSSLSAAANQMRDVGQAVPAWSAGVLLNWLLALALVLGLFFACVWLLRKLSTGHMADTQKMRIIGGVALGLREKVVLLQVGHKQLVLAVMPGRIELLTVLEGDDCLLNTKQVGMPEIDAPFTQKLMQALKARSHF